MNVTEILRSTAQKNPDKTALIFGQKKTSYKEFVETVDKLACALLQRGVKKGDPVILMLHNSWEFVVSYFSIARLGAVTVPIDVRLKGEELTSIVADSGARFLIIHRSLWEAYREFFSSHFSLDHAIIIDDRHGPEDLLKIFENSLPTALPATAVTDSDEALYYYTSGTTGKP
jgi:acyl-CoA synthetase (AMP-forming)/AMP-acid ligase II